MEVMKLGIITILLVTTALIPFVVSEASAKCIEEPWLGHVMYGKS